MRFHWRKTLNKQTSNISGADILAFIDESGARGYSRKLTSVRDHELGLMCALLIPAERIEEFRSAFQSGYERFLDAMPDGAKPHITDAFMSGNECWAIIARSVRSEFHWLTRCLQIPVIYEARRLAVERNSHERQERLVSQAKATHHSPIRISDHVNQSKIEDKLILGLAIKLDAFCEDIKRRRIDLLFDQIDDKMVQGYRVVVERARNIGKSRRVVKGWDPETKSQVRGEISLETYAPFLLETRFLGELYVVGKTDPLMLATDIVTNSLYDHLQSLAADAFLNRPSSIDGWTLEDRVYGVMDNAIDDII